MQMTFIVYFGNACIKKFSIFLFLVFICVGNAQLGNAQSKAVQSAGDALLFALPVTAFTSSLVIGDYKGTWQFTKGFLLSQALTIALKESINKPRPYNNGNYAFPSGHTSTTFQAASFIQRRYGWEYGVPAYALAGFTGYSRLQAKKHDGWDVLAGAIIGVGSTYLFTTPYQKEHMELTFTSWEQNKALGFKFKF